MTLNICFLKGIGLTPEAIETNYIQYDLMMEMTWRVSSPPVDLDSWVQNYTVRRYGQKVDYAGAAWKLLQDTIYSCGGPSHEGTSFSFIAIRPLLSIPPQCNLCHDPSVDPVILANFINASRVAPSLSKQATFQHDIATMTRQFLSDMFLGVFVRMMDSFNEQNFAQFSASSQTLLGIIEDVETVVATQEMWLVGKWIGDAKSWAKNSDDSHLYEFNARNQLTLWGPKVCYQQLLFESIQ
jgi:alpha-N-acetylglucosaminidase